MATLDETTLRQIFLKADWYLEILPIFSEIKERNKDKIDEVKEEIYNFVEKLLGEDAINIGSVGESWDAERKPIDTVVIHHTSWKAGATPEKLSAVQLLNLYASYYSNPTYEGESHIKGKPVFSNHFKDGRQVFYAYHFLVRNDGSYIRLLSDSEVGWHAGNWSVNCKSVGICIDDDLIDKEPNSKVLTTIAKIIAENYANVEISNIIGHREVNEKVICPGDLFLPVWKQKLHEIVGTIRNK